MCFVFVCQTVLIAACRPVVTCLERAEFLALLFVVVSCVLLLSHMVSWVRCGT